MLSVTRKSDRATMAKHLAGLLYELNVHYQTDTITDKRCISFYIHADDLRLKVKFDGNSCQPNVYVLSWHMVLHSDKKLKDSFGHVNQFHRQKATHVAQGFDNLCAQLRRGLKMAIDGSAFL